MHRFRSVHRAVWAAWLATCAAAAAAQAPPAPTPPAPAAGAPAAPLSVDDAVALAVRQNPRLSAAAREIVAARRGVSAAGALTNPSVTFTPGLTGPGGSDEELLFQQPLELNGTRSARRGVASAQLRQTQARAVVELRTLVAETKTAYHELARSQELRTIAWDVLRTVEEFDRGVRRQAEEGLRPLIDQTQTQIEVARARQQVTLAESQVRTAQAALNTLLGRPAEEPVAAVSPISYNAEAPGTEALVARALSSRAEIQAETAARAQLEQEGRLARAEGRPDLVPQFRAGSVTRGFSDSGVGIGISIPFLDWGSRRSRVRQAEEAARAQESRITATRDRVRREVVQAVARLGAADEVIRSYQGGVLDQSRRLLDASLKALQLGAPGASLLSVLEAQRTYRGVLTEYTNALAEHAAARAELERATGSVPATLLPNPAPVSERQPR